MARRVERHQAIDSSIGPAPPATAAAVVLPTAAMFLVLTAVSAALFTVSVVAPLAALDIGVDPSAIGVFTGIAYIVAMFTGTATGTFVDSYGPIRVCQLALSAAAFALLALIVATPLAAATSAVLFGIAYGPLNPSSAHVLARLGSPRWRPLIFSVKQTGVPAGGMVAGALVPWLVLIAGWRGAAAALALAAIGALAVLQPLRKRFDSARRLAYSRLTVLRNVSVVRPLKTVFGQPQLRRLTLVAFAYAGCQVCVGAFYVIYLVDSLGLSLLLAGGAFAFVQAGGVAGRLLWGMVAGSVARPRLLLAGLGVLTALMLASTAAVDSSWPRVLILLHGLVLGASSFGWNGVFLSQAAAAAPAGKAGETTGGVQFIMFGGVVVVPPCFGLLVALTQSYRLAFITVSAVALSAGLSLCMRTRG